MAVSTAIARALSLEDALRVISAGGFTCIELGYQHLAGSESVGKAARLATQAGLEITTLHLPFSGFDISHPEESERRRILAAVITYIRACAEHGIDLIVVHPNSYPEASGLAEWRKRNDQTVKSLIELGELAVALDVRLAVENQPTRRLRAGANIIELRQLLEELNCSHLGLCIDTVHASYNGLVSGEQILQAGSRLWAVHLADNEQHKHLHAVPGEYSLNWEQIMEALDWVGYTGHYTMEVYGPRASSDADPKELLAGTEEVVRRLFAAGQRLLAL
jgi:sugar phosphate isomerase/epimerase